MRAISKVRLKQLMSRLESEGKCNSLAWCSDTVPVAEMDAEDSSRRCECKGTYRGVLSW